MKPLLFSFLFLLCCATLVEGQTIITIKPDPSTGKDAIVHGLPGEANNNYGHIDQFCIAAWSFSGVPGNIRALVEFPLSQIPANATILSASMSLYAIDHATGFGYHSTTSGANDCWIERITAQWDESTVTWNNQPPTTPQNRASMSSSTHSNQDYLNIDVTMLLADMLANPSTSHGFMLRLKNETHYRRLNFCSSDHSNPLLRPELNVTYTLAAVVDTCFTLQPDDVDGKDAFIHSISAYAGTNWGTNEQLCAAGWTFNNTPGVIRSLLDFDLPSLPQNALVTNAALSLYAIDNSNGFGYHSQQSGSNAAWIERVTFPWDESTVTWNNQPATTMTNRVSTSTSPSPHHDYVDINVTQLVQDMYQDPTNSHGFMLKLQDENHYRRLNFCSSDHPNASKRPKLKVCYAIVSAVDRLAEPIETFSLYPNPATGLITLTLVGVASGDSRQLYVVNLMGQTVHASDVYPGENRVDLSHLSAGIYICQVRTLSGGSTIQKLVID